MFLQITVFEYIFIWHHFKVDESKLSLAVHLLFFLLFAFHLLLFLNSSEIYFSQLWGLTESISSVLKNLTAWQPNSAWLDLNHWPSWITLTIEKFQLKKFCRYRGLNPGLLPYHVFDAFTVNQHWCRHEIRDW